MRQRNLDIFQAGFRSVAMAHYATHQQGNDAAEQCGFRAETFHNYSNRKVPAAPPRRLAATTTPTPEARREVGKSSGA